MQFLLRTQLKQAVAVGRGLDRAVAFPSAGVCDGSRKFL